MKLRIILSLLFIAVVAILGMEFCKSPDKKVAAITANAYVGNATCKSCHKTEHEQWRSSHHFMAMLPATDSTVSGDFNNAHFTADGVSSTFFKKEGKFYINTEGEDGMSHDFEVKYIFGFTPLQQYLVEFPGGRMQATRASWDTKQKKMVSSICRSKNACRRLAALDRQWPELEYHVCQLPQYQFKQRI